MRFTERPIRVDTLLVQARRFGAVCEQVLAGAFVTGCLEGKRPFEMPLPLWQSQHESVKAKRQSLVFEHAPQALLAELRPSVRTDPEHAEQLHRQLREREAEWIALQLQRPPVHYLRLREATAALSAKREELTALSDTTLTFSGALFLRLPGRPATASAPEAGAHRGPHTDSPHPTPALTTRPAADARTRLLHLSGTRMWAAAADASAYVPPRPGPLRPVPAGESAIGCELRPESRPISSEWPPLPDVPTSQPWAAVADALADYEPDHTAVELAAASARESAISTTSSAAPPLLPGSPRDPEHHPMAHSGPSAQTQTSARVPNPRSHP